MGGFMMWLWHRTDDMSIVAYAVLGISIIIGVVAGVISRYFLHKKPSGK
jgi:TRAP-type C4-dicarboxylate transport system permease small subunit